MIPLRAVLLRGLFALTLFALLLWSWPLARPLYARWFRVQTSAFLSSTTRDHVVSVGAAVGTQRPEDAEIRILRVGETTGILVTCRSRGLGFVPTALFLGLALAGGSLRVHRLRALLLGFLAVQGFVLLRTALVLADGWRQHASTCRLPHSPFWTSRPGSALLTGVIDVLVYDSTISLLVVILIWLVAVLPSSGLWRLPFTGKRGERAGTL